MRKGRDASFARARGDVRGRVEPTGDAGTSVVLLAVNTDFNPGLYLSNGGLVNQPLNLGVVVLVNLAAVHKVAHLAIDGEQE